MKFMKRGGARFAEGDMTPMIDMTFQLIAFFMVLVNFSEAEQAQSVRLPSSELAKPPDGPMESPLFIHMTKKGTVIFGGDEMPIEGLQRKLQREWEVLRDTPGKQASDATIIIRADRETETGKVQKVIKTCQTVGFEKFALRAKQEQRRAAAPEGGT